MDTMAGGGSGGPAPSGSAGSPSSTAPVVAGDGDGETTETRKASIVQVRVNVPVPSERQQLDVWKRFRALMVTVDGAISRTTLGPDAQKQLAKLVSLVPRIIEAGMVELYPPVEAAIYGLLADTPNLGFAKSVRRATADRFRKRLRLLPLIIGLAIGMAVFAGAYTWIFVWQGPRQEFLGFDRDTVTNIALVTITGALSASVSLILRIKDFSRLKNIESESLLYTAIFKPMLGAAFALFVFLALQAGIVNITVSTGKEKFLFAALAFVAGFSERFAKDVISKVAGSLDSEGQAAEDGELPTPAASATRTSAMLTATRTRRRGSSARAGAGGQAGGAATGAPQAGRARSGSRGAGGSGGAGGGRGRRGTRP